MIADIYKSVFQSGKYYFLSSIVDRIASVFFFFIIAKIFSVDDYGQIVTIFAVSNIILTVFDFGLQIYLQREAATKKNIDDTFSAISFIKILFLFIYSIAVIVYLGIFYPDIPIHYIIIISAISFIINYATLLSFLYFGKNKIDVVFYSTIISKTIFILFVFILLFTNNNLFIFLLTLLVTGFLQVFILLYKLRSVDVKFIFNIKYLKLSFSIIKISFPLGLAVLFNLLYDKIDIVLISKIVGIESVGQYNIAYSSYKLVSIVFGIILVYGFNIFSKNINNKNNLKNLFHLSFPIIIISIVFILFFNILGETILKVLFGNKFLMAGNLLSIISFATLGFGLNSLTGVFINANGKFNGIMICTALGLFVNIIINIIYLPRIGVIAAVYSTIITEYVILFLESVYIYFFIYKKLKYGLI